MPFEVWALVAGSLAVALGYGVVAPVIPQYAQAFGVSNFAASGIVSAFALMRVAGAPIAGRMINRFGERRGYATGILIVAISTGACALVTNYPQLLILRGAGGVGSAMFSIAATALIIKLSPENARGRVASLNAAGFLLGMLLGPVLGGIVAGFGLRAPFVFYFFTLIVAASVVWLALRRSSMAARDTRSAEESPLSLSEALRLPSYRALLTSMFTFGWSSFGVRVSVLPLFIAVTFPGDASWPAWALAAYAAGNAALIFPAGRWVDRAGRKPLLVIGVGAAALGYFLVPVAGSFTWLLIVMVFLGAGTALVNPGQQAVLADIVGPRRGGNVVASYSMAGDIGGVLGPLIAGAIADAAGFGWAFGVTGGLLVLTCLAWLAAPESRPRAARETAD